MQQRKKVVLVKAPTTRGCGVHTTATVLCVIADLLFLVPGSGAWPSRLGAIFLLLPRAAAYGNHLQAVARARPAVGICTEEGAFAQKTHPIGKLCVPRVYVKHVSVPCLVCT